jgi:hypothetical protein
MTQNLPFYSLAGLGHVPELSNSEHPYLSSPQSREGSRKDVQPAHSAHQKALKILLIVLTGKNRVLILEAIVHQIGFMKWHSKLSLIKCFAACKEVNLQGSIIP